MINFQLSPQTVDRMCLVSHAFDQLHIVINQVTGTYLGDQGIFDHLFECYWTHPSPLFKYPLRNIASAMAVRKLKGGWGGCQVCCSSLFLFF